MFLDKTSTKFKHEGAKSKNYIIFFSELQATDFDSNICGKNDLLNTDHIIGPKNDKGKITELNNKPASLQRQRDMEGKESRKWLVKNKNEKI